MFAAPRPACIGVTSPPLPSVEGRSPGRRGSSVGDPACPGGDVTLPLFPWPYVPLHQRCVVGGAS
eukprot:12918424-Prorocentrum_lima.AAC.1